MSRTHSARSPRDRGPQRSRAGGLALVAATLLASAPLHRAHAWGQPEHAVLGEAMLRRYAAEVPPELSAPETREAFVYGCYGPDGYLFHGPEYVHLDRHFALYLLHHARDARTKAFAYGWASHQEQDVSGHGRYITDSGLDHLKKEVGLGTRLRYQGAGWEKKVVKGMRAIFDVEQIHAASQDYVARFGGTHEVVSRRHAKLAGLGYAAYLTALKGILWANWWGNLKWRPGKYPRTEWQRTYEESVVYTRDWVKDPLSFSGTVPESLRVSLFDRFLRSALDPRPALPAPAPLVRGDPAEAAHEVRRAAEELMATHGGPRSGVALAGGRGLMRHAYPASHPLLRDDQLVALGASLANSSGIRMEKRTDGSFFAVEPVVVDPQRLGEDMLELLKERGGGHGIFSDGAPVGDREEFFTELETQAQRALSEAGGELR